MGDDRTADRDDRGSGILRHVPVRRSRVLGRQYNNGDQYRPDHGRAAPVNVLLIAWYFGLEKIKPVQLISLAVALPGVALILFHDSLQALASVSFVTGDIIMLIAMLGWTTSPAVYHYVGGLLILAAVWLSLRR
ncbi:hypothetical protein QA640_02355 [Bradyrhizobium sp. CB82]|uniref:hypothetical protein n=1 Tax=Bradyrhizobium sp. CB82 TaxID=3039159 RepID=UPI0024B1F5B5|nr:hypothetical protein [Bradyrhizobium sp. CB82]WFU41398.1 hypothetical protein QA640_02355 [Bradyrhizobium sp. CB82]